MSCCATVASIVSLGHAAFLIAAVFMLFGVVFLHELGHRYRVRNRDLPGSPDVANRSRRWAVFVHGCYWHRHGCKATTTPKRNRAFWEAKFARNVERDAESAAALRKLGFTVVVVWECETKGDLAALRERLHSELNQA